MLVHGVVCLLMEWGCVVVNGVGGCGCSWSDSV